MPLGTEEVKSQETGIKTKIEIYIGTSADHQRLGRKGQTSYPLSTTTSTPTTWVQAGWQTAVPSLGPNVMNDVFRATQQLDQIINMGELLRAITEFNAWLSFSSQLNLYNI